MTGLNSYMLIIKLHQFVSPGVKGNIRAWLETRVRYQGWRGIDSRSVGWREETCQYRRAVVNIAK